MAITEHTIDDALAEVLSGTRSLWRAKGACQAITPNNSDKCCAMPKEEVTLMHSASPRLRGNRAKGYEGQLYALSYRDRQTAIRRGNNG